MQYRHDKYLLFAVAVFVLFILFFNLGGSDLSAPDEPRFALVAQEMMESGDWLQPHRNEQAYPDKPPLFFWAISFFSLFFGGEVNAWSARLPSAFAALGVLWMMWLWAKEDEAKPFRAILTVLALATSVRFMFQAHMAQIDMVLCFFTTAALLLGFRAIEGKPYSPALLGLMMGLGILAKGPVAYLIPAGVLCVAAAAKGRSAWRNYPKAALLWGLLPPLIWLAALTIQVAQRDDWAYLENLVFKQTVVRYLDPWHHYKPFYYFVTVLFHDFQPWIFPLLAAIPFTRTRWRALSEKQKYAWWVILFTILFFSISKGKRNLYILPLYPFAAYLTACFIEQLTLKAREMSWQRILWAVTAAIPLIAGLGFVLVGLKVVHLKTPEWIDAPLPFTVLTMTGFMMFGTSLFSLIQGLRVKPTHAYTGLTLFMLTMCISFYGFLLPWATPFRSARRFMENAGKEIASHTSGEAKVAMVQYRSAYRLYGAYPLVELANEKGVPYPDLPRIDDFWSSHPDGWVIVREEDWEMFINSHTEHRAQIHLHMFVGRGTQFLLVRQLTPVRPDSVTSHH